MPLICALLISATDRLYGAARGRPGRVFVAVLPVAAYALVTTLLAQQSSSQGIAGPRLAQFYEGALHLALAEGRLACAPPANGVTGEVQTLTSNDLLRVRRGIDAVWACAPEHSTAVVDSGWRDSNGWSTIDAARNALSALRPAYTESAHHSICRPSATVIARLDATAAAAFSLGDAIAGAACAIATWQQPLDAATARTIAAQLSKSHSLLDALPSAALRQSLQAQFAAARASVERDRGEQVYQQLMTLATAVQSGLASTTQ